MLYQIRQACESFGGPAFIPPARSRVDDGEGRSLIESLGPQKGIHPMAILNANRQEGVFVIDRQVEIFRDPQMVINSVNASKMIWYLDIVAELLEKSGGFVADAVTRPG
jgi:hypothetical protein